MQHPPTKKEMTHDRIVEVAARAIRRDGYDGVGVAEIMKEAGLTHGGFYSHFPSREAMLVEALDRAGHANAAAIPRRAEIAKERGFSLFRALVETYLADAQLKSAERGCTVAALVSEMPRQTADVRKASATRVKSFVKSVQQVLPAHVDPEQASVIAAMLVGTLQLARAVGGLEKGKTMLAAARKTLLDQYDRT